MSTPERDIDVVLITGAGASRELGVRGQPFPLMGDWLTALMKHLNTLGTSYVDPTELRDASNGEEFERRLGDFLRRVSAFRSSEALMPYTASFPATPMGMRDPGTLDEWYRQSRHIFDEIVNAIHESLYTEFAGRAIDSTKAESAFSDLLHALRLQPLKNKWVFATTNYDVIPERVVPSLNFMLDRGVETGFYSSSDGRLEFNGIVDQMSERRVPMLHLHGSVGWYRRDDGSIYSMNVQRHDRASGAPIVVLPDLEKVYESDEVIQIQWEQFRTALRRTRSVFILGQSLHDSTLLSALKQDIDDPARIAVALLKDREDPLLLDDSASEVHRRAVAAFGNSVVFVPTRFGVAMDTASIQIIDEWIDGTRGMNLDIYGRNHDDI